MVRGEMVDALFRFDIRFTQLRHELMEDARPNSLTPLQFQILLYIHCERECTVSSLSKGLHLATSNSSRELKKLRENGILLRLISSEDKRSSTFSLSHKGEQLVQEIFQTIRASVLKNYASLSDGDISEIVDGFRKLERLFL